MKSSYPDSNLAQQLSMISRLIKGNLGTETHLVYIDGFDTHAEQYDKPPEFAKPAQFCRKIFLRRPGVRGKNDKVLGNDLTVWQDDMKVDQKAQTNKPTHADVCQRTGDGT
ncbi:MAG: hypothetical protein IPP37_20325 [Saprospiraceae bacterium]|nr:hypothetical protein [Saprospiraceae bacterium]